MHRVSLTYDNQVLRIAWRSWRRLRFGAATLKAGTVSEGQIVRPSAFQAAFRRALKGAGLPPSRAVACLVAVPESRVFTKLLHLPNVRSGELPEAVELQAEQYLPARLEALSVSYQVLGRLKHEVLVALAATSNDLVLSIWQTLTTAGHRVLKIIPRSAALAQFATAQSHTPELFIDVEDEKFLNLVIIKNRTVRFSTSVEVRSKHSQVQKQIAAAIRYFESKEASGRVVERIRVLPSTHAGSFVRLLHQGSSSFPPVSLLSLKELFPEGGGVLNQEEFFLTAALLGTHTPFHLSPNEIEAHTDLTRQMKTFRMAWLGELVLLVLLGAALTQGYQALTQEIAALRSRLATESPVSSVSLANYQELEAFLAATRLAETARSSIGPWYQELLDHRAPEISFISVDYLSQEQRLTIVGQRGSRQSLQVFLDQLPGALSSPTVRTEDWAAEDGSVFELTAMVAS